MTNLSILEIDRSRISFKCCIGLSFTNNPLFSWFEKWRGIACNPSLYEALKKRD